MNTRITHRQTVHTRGGRREVVRAGTLTGEVSPMGLLRVEWDQDDWGRMGWLEEGDYEVVEP